MDGHNLLFRSLDIQNGDRPELASIWMDLINPFEPAEVRGEDLVIPQKPGMTHMGRHKHRRILELRGWVRGNGSEAEERQQDFYTASEALRAVLDFDLAPGTLEWLAPYLGLPAGSQAIEAKAVDAVPGPIIQQAFQRWSVRLLAIGDPPEWAEVESS